ncbi:tRNA (adenosine(37)-N6)-threonylcarbamoyltransferase complex dimerization subunit type 1 TsaB [Meiothermus granaticius NBRC 107808]|nr:tRNA (adenosine(37)-N6)-threonylcarbamoyltransferase complex dimerization subunit type 1 TsaB [Meiothermus granaticius NBRC 107808]
MLLPIFPTPTSANRIGKSVPCPPEGIQGAPALTSPKPYYGWVLVLALDTATPYLVLGLPHAERAVHLGRRHAEALWAELEDFLARHQVSKHHLEGIALGRGPGSYTGLRVGIAAGLGLGRGLEIPVVGVDTLAGVALRYQGEVSVAHTARNGLGYAAHYRVTGSSAQELRAPQRIRLAEWRPLGRLSLDEPPSGRALARLGQQALRREQTGVEGLYL